MPPQDQSPYSPGMFFARLLRKESRTATLSPEKVEELTAKYRLSMGFGSKDDLSCSHALEDFEEKRVTSCTDLTSAKVKGESLGVILDKAGKNADAKDQGKRDIAAKLDTAFVRTQEFQDASNDFSSLIDKVNERIKKNPPNINPKALGFLLAEEKGKMVTKMKAQFTEEETRLKQLAKDDQFKQDVSTHLGVTDSEFDSFMRSVLKDVKQKQQEQLKQFEQQMNKQTRDLLSQAQAEERRVGYVAWLKQRDAKVRKFVESKVGTGNADDSNALLSISLKELGDANLLSGLSGRKITYDKNSDTFQFEFPKNKNLFYHLRRENLAQDDMRSITDAVLQCGHDSIVLTVDHSNPKHADEMARMAYDAARKSGFPEDKITIKIVQRQGNQKLAKKADVAQLFDKHPRWKKRIEKAAEELKERRNPQTVSQAKSQEMKAEIAKLKTDLQGPAPAAPPMQGSP